MVDSPADALARAAKDLDDFRTFDELLQSVPAAACSDIDPTWFKLLRIVPRLLSKKISSLAQGRTDAEAIAAHVADDDIGGLRAYLKAHPASPECVLWLLAENRRLTASLAASKAAGLKNHEPRDHVAKAWADRTDTGQSKASFARMVAPEVKRRFGVSVTPERIARHWLPKDEPA